MKKSPYLCSAISNQNTMKTKKTTPYYLIIETTGNIARLNTPLSNKIRGLFSTQAKAIAELFRIATQHQEEGTLFNIDPTHEHTTSLSVLIHSQTHIGETSILGYNPDKLQIIELQIRTINPDICSLIIT